MYAPSRDDEITGIVNYLDVQLTALRAAVHGLTEDEARATPCRSALSIAGLVKHATYCMEGALDRFSGAEPPALGPEAFAAYEASFVVGPDRTVGETLGRFDEVRKRFLARLREVDPDAEMIAPPEPWHGITDRRPMKARFLLVHLIEELARHAGHADTIREQLDGTPVPALVLTRAGVPGDDFFPPYVAAAGTLT